MVNNENLSICSLCKGKCCKRSPGMFSPDQVKKELESIEQSRSIPEGFRVSTRFGRGLSYYHGLAPDTSDTTGWCINLTESGCRLSWEERPTECKILIPQPDTKCLSDLDGLSELIEVWKPYIDLLDPFV